MDHKQHTHIPIDYLNAGRERQQLTNFLRTGNFRKISGEDIIGERVKRRRRILCVIVFLIFLTGCCFAFF